MKKLAKAYVFDNNNALPVSANFNAHIPIIQHSRSMSKAVYEIFMKCAGDVSQQTHTWSWHVIHFQ